MDPATNMLTGNGLIAVASCLSLILLLLLCMKRKKAYSNKGPKNEVKLVSLKYSDDHEKYGNEQSSNKDEAIVNGNHFDENNLPNNNDIQQRPHSLSSPTAMNENRTLPNIPRNKAAKRHSSPLESVAPNKTNNQLLKATAKSMKSPTRTNSTSPKNRQLPNIPGTMGSREAVDITNMSMSSHDDRSDHRSIDEIEDTYESVDRPTVGAVNSNEERYNGNNDDNKTALYDMVASDKQDDSDLYAQVGDSISTSEENTNLDQSAVEAASGEAQATEVTAIKTEDVTYASIDKSKKISIKKKKLGNSPPAPPPIPVRNFDVDEENEEESGEEEEEDEQQSNEVQPGPDYDTLCVRESFAHQRLREEVAENQRSRYANMQTTPGVYEQIQDQPLEAVYESVSTPGSGDGVVTYHDNEADYDSIEGPNESHNISNNNSFYENVDPI